MSAAKYCQRRRIEHARSRALHQFDRRDLAELTSLFVHEQVRDAFLNAAT